MLIMPFSFGWGLPPLGFAAGPAGAQRLVDLLGQLALGPDVEGLVDRLVRHPHLRIVREVPFQPSRDLLGTVPLGQAFHDLGEQSTARHQLGRPAGPTPVLVDPVLGDHRPIPARPSGRPRASSRVIVDRDRPNKSAILAGA